MSNKRGSSLNADTGSDSDNNIVMVPSFLPPGEILGWNLKAVTNKLTKKNEYTYTVCVQTTGAFRSCDAKIVQVHCDGPCGNKLPSNHLINMGKCDHLLCKACYGLVKNTDGSYGCSNFYCWADAKESFRNEKNNYRRVINKQIHRARKLKRDGEDVKTCNESNLPRTPHASATRLNVSGSSSGGLTSSNNSEDSSDVLSNIGSEY